MNNKQRVTLLSFLAYFVMSGMLAPVGIISGPMARYFDVPITELTANFSWLTLGILAGAAVALVVFDWLALRKLMVLLYGLVVASLVAMAILDEFSFIWPLLGITGVCCGVGLAGAALIISRTYAAEQRASMLVITDGSFSVAGIVCSSIAVWLVARGVHWSGTYLFVALVAGLIMLLLLVSVLPDGRGISGKAGPAVPWPRGVWLCLAALFLYTLGQYSMLLWLPNYAETQLGAPGDQAGRLVSQFWMGMFAAQIFVAWWVLQVGVRRLLLIAAGSAFLSSLPLWLYRDIDGLIVLATVWGFANLGLLKIVLSFATQLVAVPDARLVSSLMFGASIGTAISPWLASRIVAATDNRFILQFSSACYLLLAVLLVLAVCKCEAGKVANNSLAGVTNGDHQNS